MLIAIAIAAVVGGVLGLKKKPSAPPDAPPAPATPAKPVVVDAPLVRPPASAPKPVANPIPVLGSLGFSTRPPAVDPTLGAAVAVVQDVKKATGVASSVASLAGAGGASAAAFIPVAVAVGSIAIGAVDIFGGGVDGPTALDGMSPAQQALYHAAVDKPGGATAQDLHVLQAAGVIGAGDFSKQVTTASGDVVRVGGAAGRPTAPISIDEAVADAPTTTKAARPQSRFLLG